MARLTLLAFVVGCSDYAFNQGKDVDGPLDEADAPVDDQSSWEDGSTGDDGTSGNGASGDGDGAGDGNGTGDGNDPGDGDDTGTGGPGDDGGGTGGGSADDPTTDREETDTVERVVQPAEFAVDVLFLVDNSCSMEDNQDALIANFPSFIDVFVATEGLDYHVGVISTDMEDQDHQGRLREANGVRWIDPATPDPYDTFDDMARMGIDGSGDECGRLPIQEALDTHKDDHNAGFIREDAALAVIAISDEDDMSSDFGLELEPFLTFMRDFKSDAALVTISGVVGPVPDGCKTSDPSFGYRDMIEPTSGLEHSICETDWATVLDELASNAVAMRREFFLEDIPVVDSLDMWAVEEDGTTVDFSLNVDFTYDAIRNSVELTSYVPGPYAEVFIAYDVDWGASG